MLWLVIIYQSMTKGNSFISAAGIIKSEQEDSFMSRPEYIVIEGVNVKDLASLVNHRIIDGWTLVGGVSVSLSDTDKSSYYVVAQAMKKVDGNDFKTWVQVIGIGLLLGAAIQVGIKSVDWAIPDPPRESLTIEFVEESD